MSAYLRSLLSRWRSDPGIGGNIEEWRDLPARPPRWAPLPARLHPGLAQALKERGISALYSHQAAAWDHASHGRHFVVVTGTASGKTLCYNLPVLDCLLRDPDARALYIFPTKALAQDQLTGLGELLGGIETGEGPPVAPAAYDGDTPTSVRPAIRKRSRLVITNPDMLHAGILPHHTGWATFLRDLRFVVIDEMHIYRGVFGSHVANVLRRLKRVCRFYGSAPQFILTSATIGNPAELASRLVEEETAVIDEDGSARGPKSFLIYNPPVIDRDLGLRRSAIQESVRLAEDLLTYQVQTILFARTRRSVELLLTYLRERQKAAAPPPMPGEAAAQDETIRGYRSGYLPRQRRSVERGLRQGEVRAVVATTALELGIDIGGMGASILVGYPGTIAGTWQQAGRAGRGADDSLSVLVATADPLDQFLAQHPDYFFERSPEQGLINPDNLLILLAHLRCAAFELPFYRGEAFGSVPSEVLQEFLDFLQSEGVLHHSGERYFWMADQYPAQAVPLRSASAENVVLQVEDEGRLTTLGEVDRESAVWMVHPQAVYLHEGQSYLVEELDLENHLARLVRLDPDYYTEPRSETTVALLELTEETAVQGGLKAHGEIQVTTQVIGFNKVRWHTHERIGQGEVDLPPMELQTTGYWLALEDSTVDVLRSLGLWANDPNDYGPGWNRIREQVRRRDGYRCQVCGAAENGRSHDVHHKIPFRTFASREEANRLENLITLCPSCHHRVESAVRVRSGLAGLSFALVHLAPLFLMCDSRDLGVHSDPQLPLSEGKPGVVIFDLVPAGIGFSQRLYELHDELILRLLELVANCPCSEGCPSCVGPGGERGQGGKQETLAILKAISKPSATLEMGKL